MTTIPLDPKIRYTFKEAPVTPDEAQAIRAEHLETARGDFLEAMRKLRDTLTEPPETTTRKWVCLNPGDDGYEDAVFGTECYHSHEAIFNKIISEDPWSDLLSCSKPEGVIYGVPK